MAAGPISIYVRGTVCCRNWIAFKVPPPHSIASDSERVVRGAVFELRRLRMIRCVCVRGECGDVTPFRIVNMRIQLSITSFQHTTPSTVTIKESYACERFSPFNYTRFVGHDHTIK